MITKRKRKGVDVVTRKVSGKVGRKRTAIPKPTTNLNLFLLFKTFLQENKQRHFKVFLPYNSPVEYMLRQLTGAGWLVDTESARCSGCEQPDESYSDYSFLLPPWMVLFQEKLVTLQQESEKVSNQKNLFFAVSGESAYILLSKVASDMRGKT